MYPRLSGPWLMTRPPSPMASLAARSQCTGYGSRRTAAIVFIRAGSTDAMVQGAISVPTTTFTTTS